MWCWLLSKGLVPAPPPPRHSVQTYLLFGGNICSNLWGEVGGKLHQDIFLYFKVNYGNLHYILTSSSLMHFVVVVVAVVYLILGGHSVGHAEFYLLKQGSHPYSLQ